MFLKKAVFKFVPCRIWAESTSSIIPFEMKWIYRTRNTSLLLSSQVISDNLFIDSSDFLNWPVFERNSKFGWQ